MDLERWWYRLAHVCQRLRNPILGSTFYLGICLVCTYGTYMSAHSPHLPLAIEYIGIGYPDIITTEDEEVMNLIYGVRLQISVENLQNLVMAIQGGGGENLILEHLTIMI